MIYNIKPDTIVITIQSSQLIAPFNYTYRPES